MNSPCLSVVVTILEEFFVNSTYLLFSCDGSMLMNVGPTHDGLIDPIYKEYL